MRPFSTRNGTGHRRRPWLGTLVGVSWLAVLAACAPEPEDFSGLGGPASFVNNLAALTGGSPNGDWNLWLVDDNSFGYNGFGLGAWILTLEVTPDREVTA